MGGTPTLSHFVRHKEEWETFRFQVPFAAGDRYPVQFQEEEGYLLVTHNDGTMSEAKILPERMFFVPHPKIPKTSSVNDSLKQIAKTEYADFGEADLIPRLFVPPALKEKWFASAIDSFWEKRRAAQYLEQQIADPENREEIDWMKTLRSRFLQTERNDRIIFVLDGNDENDRPHWRETFASSHAYVYTGRGSYYIPIEIELSQQQWGYVTAPFHNNISSAGEERTAIAESARRWKMVVGSQTSGLTQDLGGWPGNAIGYNTIIPFVGYLAGQTSCRFDHLNAYQLLTKLEQEGLLKYHEHLRYAHGNITFNALAHVAGKFREKGTQKDYVLDTWPMGTGNLPNIKPEEDYSTIDEFSPNIFPTAESYAETPLPNRFFQSAFWLYSSRRLAQVFADRLVARELAPLEKAAQPQVTVDTAGLSGRAAKAARRAAQQAARAETTQAAEALARARITTNELKYAKYFVTPKGIFNIGVIAVSVYGLLMLPSAQLSPDGIPNEGDNQGPELATLLGSFSTAGFLAAEARLAMHFGTNPLLYEMPLPLLAGEAGYMVTSGVTHAVGKISGNPSLEKGSVVNEIVSDTAGVGAVFLAQKVIPATLKETIVAGAKHFFEQELGPGLYQVEKTITQRVWPGLLGALETFSSLATRFFSFGLIVPLKALDGFTDSEAPFET